ncbi:MAG: UvrB/UvrC motif-containing protein, partial [Acutalibacteraceae bacterium]|nr:UvrB/UvrC motif-containing protein [Acutalibacteraceae bacterium]
SFNDIVRESQVGCAECYRLFFDKLAPSIERIHGRALHSGKKIEVTVEEKNEPTKEERIAQLKSALQDAVEKQEFELAAKLRDEIRDMEGGENA